MAAQAQLELYEGSTTTMTPTRPPTTRRVAPAAPAAVCAGCREQEARYGFREAGGVERPRTLCFTCFRMELDRRRMVESQLRRGWNAQQVDLPLADTLHELTVRRRRAQIAARRALA